MIIFITYRLEGDSSDLFDLSRCEKEYIRENNNFNDLFNQFINEKIKIEELAQYIYKIKDSNIFAYYSWQSLNLDHVITLIRCVCDYAGIMPSESIYIIAHGGNIGKYYYFEEINKENLLPTIRNTSLFQQINKIIAFKHENYSLIFRLLSNINSEINNFDKIVFKEKTIIEHINQNSL